MLHQLSTTGYCSRWMCNLAVLAVVVVAGATSGGVDGPEDDNQDESDDQSTQESASIVGLLALRAVGVGRVVLAMTSLGLASTKPCRVESDQDEPDDHGQDNPDQEEPADTVATIATIATLVLIVTIITMVVLLLHVHGITGGHPRDIARGERANTLTSRHCRSESFRKEQILCVVEKCIRKNIVLDHHHEFASKKSKEP